jgi:DNA replication protein DnaC
LQGIEQEGHTLKEQMTQDQFIAHLGASEWDNRKNRAVERAIRAAVFRYNAVLEEIDYSFERGLDRNQVERILMDIIKDRHQKRSTIITSQLPVKDWYDVIGEKTIADAILDRLVHQSLRVELYGESIRKRKTKTENDYQ